MYHESERSQKIREDFERQIDRQEFDARKAEAVDWIRRHLKTSDVWMRAYSLKQHFTSELFYVFQRDFHDYCKLAGFETKVDETGDHWVKAYYRRKPLRSPM